MLAERAYPLRIYECEDLQADLIHAIKAQISDNTLHLARVKYGWWNEDLPSVRIALVGQGEYPQHVVEQIEIAVKECWAAYRKKHEYSAKHLPVIVRFQKSAVITSGISSAGTIMWQLVMDQNGEIKRVNA